MQLLLIRHARPERVTGAPDGVADPGLTSLGRRQATALAGWLAAERVDAVVSSPARRAVETATPLGAAHGRPVAVRRALVEYDFGAADYVPIEDADAEDHPALEVWKAWAEPVEPGSALAAFRDGVSADLAELARENPGRTFAVVCHGGTINAYVSDVVGSAVPLVFAPDYTGVSRVLVDRDGRRTVRSLNETAHLRPLTAD